MKELTYYGMLWLVMLLAGGISAQNLDESSIREKVLIDIEEETDKRAKELEEKIASLDLEIQKIDEALRNSESSEEIMDKLKERVSKLEAIQMAQKQQELNIYDNNFQAAVINLVSMERELRPLILFNNSKDFFSYLSDISNPTSYPGYQAWFTTFKNYVEKNKGSDAVLSVTSKLLETAGSISGGISLVGPISEGLFLSMDKFINSFGKKKKDLREKGQEMFELTMLLSQYTVDKSMVETGWETINAELEGLQELQASTLTELFTELNIDKFDFQENYINETNALKRIDYLKSIQEKIIQKVASEQRQNQDGWKDKIYFHMTTVQSLKIRFGNITFKIKENIRKYEELIQKYKNDELIGERIEILEDKLGNLNSSFDSAFNPQKYVDDAVRMYKR